MKTTIKMTALLCMVSGLSSCMGYEDSGYSTHQYSYDQTTYYPDTMYREGQVVGSSVAVAGGEGKQPVQVPETYHVGSYHSPQGHKSRDRNWVNGQNPQGYTIELADDENAASVAGKLSSAPKKDRMAQVKYSKSGKTHYKGLYGSYESYEAAQKAYNELPPELKQGAGVKNWGSVQGSVNY